MFIKINLLNNTNEQTKLYETTVNKRGLSNFVLFPSYHLTTKIGRNILSSVPASRLFAFLNSPKFYGHCTERIKTK